MSDALASMEPMTRPNTGDEALLRWVYPGWRRRLLCFGPLLFALVFAVAWGIGAVLASLTLWRHGKSHPEAAVFLSAWLLLWSWIPVWVIQAILKARRARQTGTFVFEGFTPGGGLVFYCCFAVGWLAGLVGVLRQGDVAGFLVGVAFTTAFAPLFIGQFRYAVRRRDSPGQRPGI